MSPKRPLQLLSEKRCGSVAGASYAGAPGSSVYVSLVFGLLDFTNCFVGLGSSHRFGRSDFVWLGLVCLKRSSFCTLDTGSFARSTS